MPVRAINQGSLFELVERMSTSLTRIQFQEQDLLHQNYQCPRQHCNAQMGLIRNAAGKQTDTCGSFRMAATSAMIIRTCFNISLIATLSIRF